MLEFIDYETEEKTVGTCSYCGADINTTSDHYEFGNEYICEDCKFAYLENHLVYGDDDYELC